MAGRPPKTTVDKKDTEAVKIEETSVVDESDNLKKENELLKQQLQDILEKMKTRENDQDKVTKDKATEDNFTEINPLKPIKVVSLSDGGVNLKTSNGGNSKIFRLDKFGHSISITYADLQDVIATCRTFIEDGTVYICDESVVKNNYLDECYQQFLTIDKITNILSFSESQIEDMISNTTEAIQETVISLVVKKIVNNESVDMNKVNAIGKSCKTPCDIPSLALQKRIG